MSDNGEGRSGRFTLKGWHVILAAIAAAVALIVLYVVIARGRLDRRLEALRAAGYPTSFADLAEYNRLPAGAANAFDVYAQAFAAYVAPLDAANTPHLGTARWPDRGVPLPEPMVKAVSQCLAGNQQCLSLLHEAAGIQDCDYDWDWSKYATGIPQLGDLRHCAQLLGLSATCYAHVGDPNAAVRCIEDGLRLADSLRREPLLISYLVRTACIGLMLVSLERGLNVAAFADEQLARLDRTLTAVVSERDLTQALITERCAMIQMCRSPSLLGTPPKGIGPHMLPGAKRLGIEDTLNYMGDCIEASKQPPMQSLAGFREAARKVEDLSAMHVMIKLLAPAMDRVAEVDLRTRAGIDLARTALAIERHRLATGRLPERLEELVPQYLNDVPTDPFYGQPIRYRRTEPGYVVYSVLEDGDNAGKERDPKNQSNPYDWPFIMTR